jgi:hypothetical protein
VTNSEELALELAGKMVMGLIVSLIHLSESFCGIFEPYEGFFICNDFLSVFVIASVTQVDRGQFII